MLSIRIVIMNVFYSKGRWASTILVPPKVTKNDKSKSQLKSNYSNYYRHPIQQILQIQNWIFVRCNFILWDGYASNFYSFELDFEQIDTSFGLSCSKPIFFEMCKHQEASRNCQKHQYKGDPSLLYWFTHVITTCSLCEGYRIWLYLGHLW